MTDAQGPGASEPGRADQPGVDDPGRGRRIAIDVGSVRIGVAASDPDGILATPVETVPRAKSRADTSDLARLVAIVEEYEAVEVIVGLPQTLRGERGAAAGLALQFADRLRDRIAPVPVRMTDERFTTVTASRALRESGVKAKGQRSVIDQAAAVAILQGWLDQRSAVLRTAQTEDFSTEDHE
ncbi:Holliday junction resolvase RuvX [Rhodococcus sp. NPDC003322]